MIWGEIDMSLIEIILLAYIAVGGVVLIPWLIVVYKYFYIYKTGPDDET